MSNTYGWGKYMLTVMKNHKDLEFKVYGSLVQLLDILRSFNASSEDIERIRSVIDLIKTRKFSVAVVGEFKRGKSSLINALLGSKVLPSDVTPTTATINRITYGAVPALEIHFHNGEVKNVDISNISQYVTMLTDEASACAAQIKEAVVRYPTVLCQNHVDIIDTPGLSDSQEMTKITLKMMEGIDAAIVVISALAPFADTEMKFVIELIEKDHIENIIFVMTYIDQIDLDERDIYIAKIYKRVRDNIYKQLNEDPSKQYLLQKAHKALDHNHIYGVSSTMALQAFVTGNRELLSESRYESFKNELYTLLTSAQGLNTISKSAKSIMSVCNNFENFYTLKLDKLKKEIEDITQNCLALKEYQKRCWKLCEGVLSPIKADIKKSFAKVFELKNGFLDSFTLVIKNHQQSSSIILVKELEELAKECCTIADTLMSRINPFIYNKMEIGLNKLLDERKKFLQDNEALKAYTITDKDLHVIFLAFGFPQFNWQASPIPSSNLLRLYPLMDNATYAIDVSVQTFFTHLNTYVDAITAWWIDKLSKDADYICKIVEELAQKRKTQMAQEAAALTTLYEQKLPTVKSIKCETQNILDRLGEQDEYAHSSQ